MKLAKQILALMLTALLLCSSCAVAASAAGDLQAQIDAAKKGDTVTLTADATGSIVIDKDMTLDLGGYKLAGTAAKPAITIKNADVTITNGHVYSKFAAVRTVTMLETVKDESPAAIRVEGGNVNVDGVRVLGSFTRVPGQQEYALPTGNAVELLNDATATVSNATLIGRYGVNNKVTGQPAGGNVTIEDGILIGFLRAVKDSSKEILSGAEKVNVADRIEGYLNNGIKLEAREKRVLKAAFADKAFVYTQSVQDDALVTINYCADGVTPISATVTAHEDASNLWQNNTSTDCSYKYVPEYAILADGKLVKLEKDGDDYTATLEPEQAEDVTIKYRLEFEMQPEIKAAAENFDEYLEKAYNTVIATADSLYAELCNKYNNYVALVGNVWDQVDEMGQTPINGRYLCDTNAYQQMVRVLLDLGGETMYFNGDTTQHFEEGELLYFYGDENYTLPEGEYYGVLDHVAEMKAQFEALKGASFADQSKWADLGYWLYENYPTVIEMIDDVAEKIAALQDLLSSDLAQAMIAEGGMQQYEQTLTKIQTIIGDVQSIINMLLENSAVNTLLTKVENNKGEIKYYINKFIGIYNNHNVYFTPEKFIDGENGEFVKAYSVRGATEQDESVAEDHEWDEGVVTAEAVCEQDGEILYTCTICGATRTETIDQLEHAWSDWVELDTQHHQRTCANENCPIGTQTEDHVFEEDEDQYVEPTCTEEGLRVYVCTECGATENEILSKAEHTWDEGSVTKDPTCTEEGEITYTCTECGATTTEPIAPTPDEDSAHDWDDGEVTTAPTCADEGELTYTCTRCGTTKTEPIAATPDEDSAHDWDDGEVTTAPTCVDEGELTYTCARCGATKTEPIAPTPDDEDAHQWDEGEVTTAPTCVDEGETTYTCALCGATRTESIDPQPDNDEAHQWDDGEVTLEPNCTDEGEMTYTCALCGTTKTEPIAIDPEAHDWDHNDLEKTTWLSADYNAATLKMYCTRNHAHEYTLTVPTTQTVVLEPTCAREGILQIEADFVDEDVDLQYHMSVQRMLPIDPDAHQWDDGVVTTEPTCVAEGEKTFTCTLCGATTTEPVDVDPDAHQWDDGVVTKEPTCTEEGEMTYTCELCGATKTEPIAIDDEAHAWDEGVVTTEPTCVAEGEMTYTCTLCGTTKTESIAVDPEAHDYEAVVTEPTCTEQGYTTYTCKNDATHTYVDDYTDALDHDWGDWTVVRPATPTEPGEKKRVCKRCGEEETAPIEQLILHSSCDGQEGSALVVNVVYAKRGELATQLTANQENVTYTSSNPQLVQVDKDGNVTFTRLCLFCKSATITAVSEDGTQTATCEINIQVKWWQYIIWLLLGSLWF